MRTRLLDTRGAWWRWWLFCLAVAVHRQTGSGLALRVLAWCPTPEWFGADGTESDGPGLHEVRW